MGKTDISTEIQFNEENNETICHNDRQLKKCLFLEFLIDSERTRDLDGFSFVGLNPCNSKIMLSLDRHVSSSSSIFFASALVLRGLDILTAKEIIEAKLIELTLVYMKNCAIVKDNYTGVSRGFAFVEYNSIHVRLSIVQKIIYMVFVMDRIRY